MRPSTFINKKSNNHTSTTQPTINMNSSYSLKQAKFWCHNCSLQFSRLIDTSQRCEMFCSRCNNVCEEISSHNVLETRNFIPFSHGGGARTEDQNENRNESNRNSNNGNNGFHRFLITHTFFFPEFDNNVDFNPFISNGSFLPNDGLFFIINNFFNVGGRQQENPNPPADKNVVLNLKEIVVDEKNEKQMNEKECTICQENFKAKEIGKELKCNHLYHKDCIERWLKMHSTCPCCRSVMA